MILQLIVLTLLMIVAGAVVSAGIITSNKNEEDENNGNTETDKKEFEKTIEFCTTSGDNCNGCPLCDQTFVCGAYFTRYIKENEPAPSANDTSSNENNLHLDDSTLLGICQAFEDVNIACSSILAIYENMSENEQRAFDMGETYRKMLDAKNQLDEVKGR